MPLGAAAPARHVLKGKLTFAATMTSSAHRGCRGSRSRCRRSPWNSSRTAIGWCRSSAGSSLPRRPRRGPIQPRETVIVSPGRVWSEPGDQGMSRASFPFVSVNELNNGTHNGLATFLFDDTRVSAVSYQFVQETMAWERTTTGAAPLAYAAGAIAGESDLRARFDEEVRRQAPMRPWSALPVSARPLLDGFDGEVGPDDVSASGLVVDGVLHVRGCNTRYGPYPYCREMRHGVFSVTKSLGAAIALLRLAQKYGDAVFDARIADYVPIAAPLDGWERVTFADALGMATGLGEGSPQRHPNDPLADENKPRMLAWIGKRTAKDKLEAGFAYPNTRGDPARSSATTPSTRSSSPPRWMPISSAGPVRAHTCGDMVTREVYEPIGIFHAPMLHTLETDGSRGIPLLAYGLYPTVDDIAKLTTLLQAGGRHDGQQLLSARKLAEALYRTSPDSGLPLGWHYRAGEGRYNLSFWSIPYRTSTGCFLQVPMMLGYGGNLVVLLPNGVSAFRFADAGSSDAESMILAGEAIRPLCAPSAAAAVTPARAAMTAGELRAELVGRAFDSGIATIAVDRSGVVTVDAKGDVDVGRWHITTTASYCRTWNVGDRGRPRCYRVYRDGEAFELHAVDRWTVTKLRRQP
jgi:hypothetical protein